MYFYSIQIIHVNILGHQSQINAESICSSTQPQPNCFLTKPHYDVAVPLSPSKQSHKCVYDTTKINVLWSYT